MERQIEFRDFVRDNLNKRVYLWDSDFLCCINFLMNTKRWVRNHFIHIKILMTLSEFRGYGFEGIADDYGIEDGEIVLIVNSI